LQTFPVSLYSASQYHFMNRHFEKIYCALGLFFTVGAPAGQFKFPTQTFTVPDGFEVELAAGTNVVQRPVSASFDDQGRLYVTDSSGSNDKPDIQLKNPSARVLRLEDTDGDGRYDKASVFADKVMFPQGCLWHDGWVYVAAPPSIWRFRDTNGDGVADQREEWFKGVTLTGCANDIHGPYLGPDGYIYWTKGAFAEQTHKLGNGRTLKDRAAHIFRARPDGSDLDVIMTGGMDNPVEVAFTPEGETIFTSTFIDFSKPGYRDGIAHAAYGAVFGKIHDVIEDGRVKRTSPEVMHPFYQAGPAAECGLCRYESDVFGPDYRDNLFATTFNLHKVTRHILKPNDATYASTDSDFLVSDSVDFHPTDVLEDADGSLLVVDTGGWYKLCCPSSQLAKPDVLGAIYRVRRKDAPKVQDPCGLQFAWGAIKPRELTKLLGDRRLFVRNRAVDELSKLGDAAVPALREVLMSAPKRKSAKGWGKKQYIDGFFRIEAARIADWPNGAAKRQNAVWSLTRIGAPRAREAVRLGFRDVDSGVRVVALKSAALHRDPKAGELGEPDSSIFMILAENRAYFELLGRTGLFDKHGPLHVSLMLDEGALEASENPVLNHSFIYSMIESKAAKSARQFLKEGDFCRPSALIALDQMDGSDLKPTEVVPFLSAAEERLRTTANWILSRHPDWGGELAGWIRQRLTSSELTDAEHTALDNQLHILTHAELGQQLLADAVTGSGFRNETRVAALNAIAGAGLKQPPASWNAAVLSVLGAKNPSSLAGAVRAARNLNGDANVVAALRALGRDAGQPAALRLDALAALPAGAALDTVDFDFLRTSLTADSEPITRSTAAGVLARAKLETVQLTALTNNLKSAGPLELNTLLGAFDGGGDDALGQNLLAALRESKSAKALPPSQLKPHFAKFPETTQTNANEFLASLNVDAAKQAANLEALLTEITTLHGDIRRGQLVFTSSKTACVTCHEIGYVGGHLGPSLTGVGKIRTERDLLEAVVYPSASFVRSFEPMRVINKSGDDFSGVLRKDAPDEVVLATGPETEVRIARADIADMRPGMISVMPQGLDTQLSKQELADLITFLKSMK
jgi:putative membrane-bound dehydrogenase-like protein